MKLLIDIHEEDYKTIKSGSQMVYSGMRSGKSFLIKMLSAVLSGTPIPDNATNGEIMEKVFGKEFAEHIWLFCRNDWWNAPYKKGEEE